jgi:hypothetical protein
MDGVNSACLAGQLQLEMLFAHHALAVHPELPLEQGLRKALSPHLLFQSPRHLHGVIVVIEFAIGFQHLGQVCRGEQALRHGLEGALEFGQILLAQAEPGHGVAAEFLQQMGMAFDTRSRVVQVQAERCGGFSSPFCARALSQR